MARTRTSHIGNMTAEEVADNTREIYRVTSDTDVLAAVDAWDEHEAGFDEWLLDNAGLTMDDYNAEWSEEHDDRRPPEFAAVVDRAVITDKEAIFVECRFFMTHTDVTELEAINASWCQINATNIPGIIASDFAILVKVFNARRAYLGLNPS